MAAITEAEWAKPTRLRVIPSQPACEVFTLVAHINVATHMVQDLVVDTTGGTPNNDHTIVHGLDLTAALEKPPHLTVKARRSCAAQLAELLQSRRGMARPVDLSADIAFIEVACGRRLYGDARFPILQ